MKNQNIDLVFKFRKVPPLKVHEIERPDPQAIPDDQNEDRWSYLGYTLGGMVLGCAVVMMAIAVIEHFK